MTVFNEEGPECPYCHYVHDGNTWMDTAQDEAPLTCAGCKRQFHCVAHRSVEWESSPLQEDVP